MCCYTKRFRKTLLLRVLPIIINIASLSSIKKATATHSGIIIRSKSMHKMQNAHKSDADFFYSFLPTHKRDNRTNNNVENLHSLRAIFPAIFRRRRGSRLASLNAKLSTHSIRTVQRIITNTFFNVNVGKPLNPP